MRRLHAGVCCIDDLLSAGECADIAVAAEREGFCVSPMTQQGRFNEEVFLTQPGLARRIRRCLPAGLEGAAGDDVVEVYRYGCGGRIAPHVDLPRRLQPACMSNATLLVSLCDGFEGGGTRFPALGLEVRMPAGAALVFAQSLMHEAMAVTRGVKLVARLDLALPPGVLEA
jgi:hypothetical protein